MSSRNNYPPYPVIDKGDMSTSLVSKVTIIQPMSLASYSFSWTGTSPLGVVAVQVSNDYSQNIDGSVRNPGTWNTLPLSAATPISGNSDTGFIDIDAQGGHALRVIYTRTSGTGILEVTVSAKVA